MFASTAMALPPSSETAAAPPVSGESARLTAMFEQYLSFVWRSLRRLGVPDANVDDAAQEVFMVAARRMSIIDPAKEKSFLFGVAMRVAADARRSRSRRREEPLDTVPETAAGGLGVDEAVDHHRARALLDQVVSELPEDTRAVFLLHELEGLTMADIAIFLELPPGTVASRLRRGREEFTQRVARLQRSAR